MHLSSGPAKNNLGKKVWKKRRKKNPPDYTGKRIMVGRVGWYTGNIFLRVA